MATNPPEGAGESQVGCTFPRGRRREYMLARMRIHRRKYLGVAAHPPEKPIRYQSDREYLTHDSPSYSVGEHSPAEESRLQHQKRTLGTRYYWRA